MSALLSKTLRSSTFKLALICIAIFGAVVFALLGYVYSGTAAYVRGRSDHAIETERAQLQEAYRQGGRPALVAAIEERVADHRFEGAFYLLADARFVPLAGNLKLWPASLRDLDASSTPATREWMPGDGQPMLRARLETLSDGSHLLIGTAIGDLDEFTRRIGTALAWSALLLLVLAGVATIAVTRRTVGRIESINATSRSIMQSGLGQRIPLRGTRDEWDQVAENLNSMLDRIETLMGEVRQVTDNVAHDLRTPLARMRGRLEKAHARPREAESDQALIGDTIADLDAVLRIFASLTRISQVEASDRTIGFRAVNLTAIAAKVVELCDAAIEERGGELTLIANGAVTIMGDQDLLFDALANLVDNAIKHGRQRGRVTVEVRARDATATVTVADDGPGIPAEEHQHVFKRFYRLENSRRTPGHGLGLSLVAAVARLHRAEIELADNAPGLAVRLAFRLEPEPAPVRARDEAVPA